MENNDFQKDVNDKKTNTQKGKMIALIIIVIILTLIIGIGGGYLLSKNDKIFIKDETQSNNADNEKKGNKTTNEVVKVVSNENDTRQMIIEGKDKNDNTVWTYTTPAENIPDEIVNKGQKLIETRKEKVYLCDWGKLYILDEQTGEVLAKNTENNIGAAKVYAFDENDYLYTVSYLAGLYKFDTNAKVIKSTEELWDRGFAWPQKMTINGNNIIIDYGEEGIATVNKDTFKVVENETKMPNNEKSTKKQINKLNLSDENLAYAVSDLNDFSDGMKLTTDDYMLVAYNMINDKIVKVKNDSDEVGVIGVSEDEINSIIYSIFGLKSTAHGSFGDVLKYQNGQYILEKSDRGSSPVIKNISTDIAAGTKYITYDLYIVDYKNTETCRKLACFLY